eukprot:COSAG05_NODE_626_length_8254_cov_12.820846_6_plen_168_part_00
MRKFKWAPARTAEQLRELETIVGTYWNRIGTGPGATRPTNKNYPRRARIAWKVTWFFDYFVSVLCGHVFFCVWVWQAGRRRALTKTTQNWRWPAAGIIPSLEGRLILTQMPMRRRKGKHCWPAPPMAAWGPQASTLKLKTKIGTQAFPQTKAVCNHTRWMPRFIVVL